MLVLSRRHDEAVEFTREGNYLGSVVVRKIKPAQVSLVFKFQGEVEIIRKELREREPKDSATTNTKQPWPSQGHEQRELRSLILTRRVDQAVQFVYEGQLLGTVIVTEIKGGDARLGFEFGKEVEIFREGARRRAPEGTAQPPAPEKPSRRGQRKLRRKDG
jgi:sRNA-binding carbon storage regulator CsrA